MNGKTRDTTLKIEQLESRTMLSIAGLPIDIGSPNVDSGKRVIATPDGGYLAAGLFGGTVDFDPGPGTFNMTSRGDTDIYLTKYTSAGALQWAKQIGGSDAFHNEIDKLDNISFAADPERAGGNFINGVTSDPELAGEYINDLAVDSAGNIYLAGDFSGHVDFDPSSRQKIFSTFDNDFYDAYVEKLTSTGTFVWADQFGGRFTDTAKALALDTSGNIYVTGLFTRTVSFVPGNPKFTLIADGRADGYLMQLNSRGSVQWVDPFGGDATGMADRDAGEDVAVDTNGNVYVVGTFAGSVDFDPSPTAQTIIKGDKGTDGFIAKYTTSGAFERVASFDGKNFEGVNNVAIDSQNNILLTGYFEDDLFDADPGPGVHDLIVKPPAHGNSNLTDLFVEKLSPNLRLQWVQQLAGNGNELADQIAIDSTNHLIIGGAFYGRASFGHVGPSITSTPGVDNFDDPNDSDRKNSYDAFLWKLDTNGGTTWVRTIGQASDDFGTGVGITADDSVLFTGRFRGTTDFDTTAAIRRLRGLGLGDAFVTGFTADGVPAFDAT